LEEIIKPLLQDHDIKRYSYKFANKWLINIHNGLKSKNIDPIDVNNYPAIKKHLDNIALQVLYERSDFGITPYNLRNCAYLDRFEKPKIVYPNMTKFLPFIYDNTKFYTNQKCFIITHITNNTSQLQFMIGYMNSKVAHYWIRPELQGGTTSIFFKISPFQHPQTHRKPKSWLSSKQYSLKKHNNSLPSMKNLKSIPSSIKCMG